MKKKTILITLALSLAIICLISSADAQGTKELGGIEIAFVEINECNCIIGIEAVGSTSDEKDTLIIEINNTLPNIINMLLRDRSPNHYIEYELELEGTPTLTITSKDEYNRTTSEVTIAYIAHLYIFIELTDTDGFATPPELRQPSRHVDEEGDWLNCIWRWGEEKT